METNVYKGFIQDWSGKKMLPITRAELVLDSKGNVALTSDEFLAKDGHPGLVTAAERLVINSITGTGGALDNIADVYTKLDYINEGFQVNGQTLKFYNSTDGSRTPINLTADANSGLNLGISQNTISVSLAELNTAGTTVDQIVKSIKVDKYGRVTEVVGGALLDSEIPATLSNKTLVSGVLQGCTTDEVAIPDNALAIVNKAYVDKKVADIAITVTGGLKWGGSLSTADSLEKVLTTEADWHKYFKVTREFAIKVTDLYDSTGITGSTIQAKVGDTLIVHADESTTTRATVVHVPSGDDITTISVKRGDETTPTYDSHIGNVVFKFNEVFNVTNTSGSDTVQISLLPATDKQDGYLTKEDWVKFNSYSSNLATVYTGEFQTGEGVYKIGNLNIGGVDNFIYGKTNISALSLENGETSGDRQAYNPILKFTETGAVDTNIQLKGDKGVNIKKNGDVVEFYAANESIAQESPLQSSNKINYITIEDGYKFGVQLGAMNNDGTIRQDGLVDFRQMLSIIGGLTINFETIENSLLGDTVGDEYRYGNVKLKDAVNITI